MITIKVARVAHTDYEINDFFRSISSHASSMDEYEIVHDGSFSDLFSDKIHFVKEPSNDSKIHITLPDNCVVLGRDWDKYINYNLKNDKPIDPDFIKRRLGLVGRPDNGVFPDLSISFP